jgi:hypothetical protein
MDHVILAFLELRHEFFQRPYFSLLFADVDIRALSIIGTILFVRFD